MSSLNSSLSSFIIIDSYTEEKEEQNADSWTTFSYTFTTHSGYTPYLLNCDIGSNGSGYGYANLVMSSIDSSGNFKCGVRNFKSSGSTAIQFNITFSILFIKNL